LKKLEVEWWPENSNKLSKHQSMEKMRPIVVIDENKPKKDEEELIRWLIKRKIREKEKTKW
jgi:hypothetical protein